MLSAYTTCGPRTRRRAASDDVPAFRLPFQASIASVSTQSFRARNLACGGRTSRELKLGVLSSS